MKKRLVVCFGVLVVALSIWLIPFAIARVELSNLKIEDVSKIIYVQYEDMPLTSEVKNKRTLTAVNDEKQLKDFVSMFQEGDVKLKATDTKTSDMLFLYFEEDDRVVNAYVVGDSLGFQYGKYWVELNDIDSLITSMEQLNNVEVQDLTLRSVSGVSIP